MQDQHRRRLESAIRHDFKRATFQLAEILVDDLGDKVANEAIKGELEGGFDAYDLIDFEISGSAFGNFSNDDFFPGIPGSGDHDTLFATEILSYLELQKGVHTFGINVHVGKPDQNDEDQFRVFIGSNPRDYFSKSLGEFELTLLGFKDGPNDTTFDFSVEKDGLYPVRIVYWNKTRGAGLEFYSVDRETGGKFLLTISMTNAQSRLSTTFPFSAHLMLSTSNQSLAPLETIRAIQSK